ncbi:MAG TPA: hypothetical protein VFZ68_18365 [Acidimicrobiales bacterium]
MTPQEAIARIGQSTAHDSFVTSNDVIGGAPVLVARTSQFRLRWFATKLYTFLVAGTFPPGTATPDQLDGFMRAAVQYGKANKSGLPVGLQTGLAAIPVAVTEHADSSAHVWAATPHGRKFGVLTFPVLLDAATGEVTHPPRLVMGGVYSGYLKEMVAKHVTTAVGGRATNG